MKIVSWLVFLLTGPVVLMSLTYKGPLRAGSKHAAMTREKGIESIRAISPFTVAAAMKNTVAIRGVAGFSKGGRPIEAYYFPGTSDKRAMVIGGVHGSELSAIEVARTLLDQLSADSGAYYSVLVVPCLFPDNAEQAKTNPDAIGSTNNIGRYSKTEAADPNRQMPALGTPFNRANPLDLAGRMIEPENQLLLQLIQEFCPERIVNLHAIRVAELGGVYADPRTTAKGIALEYASDSILAIGMAKYIQMYGGDAPGNHLQSKPTALYYCDPPVAPAGELQKRNLMGSKLPGNRGYGVSLGSWASTAVEDSIYKNDRRPAIRLLTMEFPGYKRPADYTDPVAKEYCAKQVKAYASAVRSVFLSSDF